MVSTSIPIKGNLVFLPDIVDAFLWFIFRFIGYGINLTQKRSNGTYHVRICTTINKHERRVLRKDRDKSYYLQKWLIRSMESIAACSSLFR